MVVIGSGPAGHRAAIQAAKLEKRVAVVERLPDVGGVNVNTGTASKTLREAVMHLTGYIERNVYGESYSVKQDITMSDLMVKTRYVMRQQVDILRGQLSRNRVETISAEASFVDRHTTHLSSNDGESNRTVTADKVVIAVGSSPPCPPLSMSMGGSYSSATTF